MLECGTNFKGTIPELCTQCEITDNESHRLNVYKNRPNVNTADITNFQNIYSNNDVTLTEIIKSLESVWEFCYANGKMKQV